MAKKSKHKNIWQNIRFKYKLSILNEKTLEEAFAFRLSLLSVIQGGIAFFIIILLLVSALIATTPIKNFLPGYLDIKARQDIVNNALKADSLEELLKLQERYLIQVKSVLSGNVKVDSLTTRIDELETVSPDKLKASKKEEKYRIEYEEEEKYNLSLKPKIHDDAQDIAFIRPAKGTIKSNFDLSKQQTGIAMMCDEKSPIMAILQGEVMLTGLQENGLSFIQLVHANGFVSIYKNCSQILKTTGMHVNTGDAIANSATKNERREMEPFIIEIWHKGKPVNPAQYIVF